MSDDQTPDVFAMRRKVAAAVAAMQEEALAKTATGGERGGKAIKYTHLNDVLDLVRKHLSARDLVLTQPISPVEGQERVQQITTLITDKTDGNFLVFTGPIFPVPNDPQAAGSAITYNRRYSLVTLFALEQEDDDGAQAKRAAVSPDRRTEAEIEIRRMIGEMKKEDQDQFVHDFREHFQTTLTALPESKHGDALTWAKAWTPEEPFAPTTDTQETDNGE